MESPDDGTADTSFFIRDTAFSTASVASVAHQIPMYWATPSSRMLYILALLQSRFIDIIPIVHQPSLGSVGAGLTATIHQCFISDRFGLVFKELATAAQFVKELSFVSARAIRLHPFMTTLQGVCWVTTEDEEEPWFTRPVLVFEKAAYSLWSFMHEEVGRNLIDAQRFSLCIQLATALVDLEQLSESHDIDKITL